MENNELDDLMSEHIKKELIKEAEFRGLSVEDTIKSIQAEHATVLMEERLREEIEDMGKEYPGNWCMECDKPAEPGCQWH